MAAVACAPLSRLCSAAIVEKPVSGSIAGLLLEAP
jgi:hypothetical protein